MNYFLNLKNGLINVNTYRLPEAISTTQDDLYKSYQNESKECLTASIENKLYLVRNGDSWIAEYTGLTGSEEFVFEEQAHNIQGRTANEAADYAARDVWGFDIDETKIEVNE